MSEQMFEHNLVENWIELMMAIVIEMVIMFEMMATIAMFFIEIVVAMTIEIATMKFPTAVEINGVETKRGINSDEDTMATFENTMIEDTIVKVLTTGTGQVGSTSPQSRMVEIAETKIENDIVKQYEQESSTRRTR